MTFSTKTRCQFAKNGKISLLLQEQRPSDSCNINLSIKKIKLKCLIHPRNSLEICRSQRHGKLRVDMFSDKIINLLRNVKLILINVCSKAEL